MDVSRTTVPGGGTLYQFRTHGGQELGVLVDSDARRRLLVYGSADFDVPSQTILLDTDEADRVADVLLSRSISERLAALERRLAGSEWTS